MLKSWSVDIEDSFLSLLSPFSGIVVHHRSPDQLSSIALLVCPNAPSAVVVCSQRRRSRSSSASPTICTAKGGGLEVGSRAFVRWAQNVIAEIYLVLKWYSLEV